MAMLSAQELADCLARDAEAVCRYYLSAGHKAGQYWIAGDVANNKGRSLYVHLTGPRKGRWADAATAQYGDMLDLVRETCGLVDFRDVADEARRFLNHPNLERHHTGPALSHRNDALADPPVVRPAAERARRLFRMTEPLSGTPAERYLCRRGIMRASSYPALRFHPACYYRNFETGKMCSYPALIAAVTDPAGTVTGVHRTYLSMSGSGSADVGKADVDTPRRALGGLLGNAVRFNYPAQAPVTVMAAGEGLESMLSLSDVMPDMPMVAALTANHLAAFQPPAGCMRLYIAADADAAGRHGIEGLSRRAQSLGILPLVLAPELGDFNEDLRQLGENRLAAHLKAQLAPQDVHAFLPA